MKYWFVPKFIQAKNYLVYVHKCTEWQWDALWLCFDHRSIADDAKNIAHQAHLNAMG